MTPPGVDVTPGGAAHGTTGTAWTASTPASARTRQLRLLRLDLRTMARSATILGALTAGLTAMVVWLYPRTVAGPADLAGLELVAGNPAIRVLFGVPRALDTAGGFTVWRTGMIAAVAIAAWALAVATRLTRGDEDAGRSWLLLATPIRLRTTVAVHLLALWVVTTLLAATTAAAMIMAGAGPQGALLYAAGLAGVGWFFAALGACCGQLLDERSQATGAAGGVVLVALLVRMIGDGVTALRGISWLTPFGLLSLSEPYAADRWLPMVLLALGSVGLCVVALGWSSRRDVGAGLIVLRATRRPRLALVTSAVGFAARRVLPSLLGWGAALVAYFLLIGLLAVSLTDFLAGNPRFAQLAAAAGFADLVRVEGYAASLLRLLPIPLGLFAALRIARPATDEARGRWTTLFCTPVRRRDWPLIEALVVTLACVTLAVATAVATWVGAAVVDAGLSVGDALAGAFAVLPVALLSLGAAVLAWGWAPRAVLLIGALPSVGGFVWWVLGESLTWPAWARSVSPYEHLAAVPAEPPDPAAIVVMVVLAALLLLGGVAGFVRRDLRG